MSVGRVLSSSVTRPRTQSFRSNRTDKSPSIPKDTSAQTRGRVMQSRRVNSPNLSHLRHDPSRVNHPGLPEALELYLEERGRSLRDGVGNLFVLEKEVDASRIVGSKAYALREHAQEIGDMIHRQTLMPPEDMSPLEYMRRYAGKLLLDPSGELSSRPSDGRLMTQGVIQEIGEAIPYTNRECEIPFYGEVGLGVQEIGIVRLDADNGSEIINVKIHPAMKDVISYRYTHHLPGDTRIVIPREVVAHRARETVKALLEQHSLYLKEEVLFDLDPAKYQDFIEGKTLELVVANQGIFVELQRSPGILVFEEDISIRVYVSKVGAPRVLESPQSAVRSFCNRPSIQSFRQARKSITSSVQSWWRGSKSDIETKGFIDSIIPISKKAPQPPSMRESVNKYLRQFALSY